MIEFAESERSSLGVEWELVLVDPDTGVPVNRAPEVFAAMSTPDGSAHPNLRYEYLKNTVEIVTNVCGSVAEAEADLRQTLTAVQALVRRDGFAVTSMGLHPFAAWRDVALTDSERYRRLASQFGWWGRQLLIFGVHTHVGIEHRDKVAPIMAGVLAHYGQLQAISAASPFWNGENTGYASNRSMLFRQLPSSGLPPEFKSWREIATAAEQMLSTGLVQEFNELRWDVRPSPSLGTVELRICDGVPTIAEVLALAALAQCLVEHISTLLDAGEPTPRLPYWLVAENKWRAARYGLDAELILDTDGRHASAPEAIRELVELLMPTAQRLGCADHLSDVYRILEVEPSYLRQLAVAKAHDGQLDEVVKALVTEHVVGAPW